MEETLQGRALTLEWIEGDMPYSPAFGDHFYCRQDGRAECGHVFLAGNGLPERWRQGRRFTIGELGFGTGLNFCETWRVWKAFSHSVERETPPQPLPTGGRGLTRGAQLPKADAERLPGDDGEEPVSTEKPLPLVGRGWGGESHALHFISHELYPMDRESIDKALSRWPELEAERRALTAAWPDRPEGIVEHDFGTGVRLTVVVGDALESLGGSELAFDAWYLDGFAPSRNPAMWSEDLLRAVFAHTRPGGSFATYAAAGFVRRNLVAAGFDVKRRPGFAGKREMLCGVRGG
jgi:tRNA U34 5-methylaminomethyl-2-thiouridine-forming methyltransferase MnmC